MEDIQLINCFLNCCMLLHIEYIVFIKSSPNTKICVSVIQYNKTRYSGKYLLIYNLFKDAAKCSDYIAPNFGMIVNDELKGISKEIIMA
jgi:hypothetical protein